MEITVVGPGCSKCRSTVGIIERAAQDAGVAVKIVKVETREEMQHLGVHATPAVIIDGHMPVSQAAALQEDLRRARIEPYAWVINKSVLAAGTHDRLLAARLAGERQQIERIGAGLAKRVFTLPWLVRAPIGLEALSALVRAPEAQGG